MDDNFASIVRGIEEGRRLYDNLKKTIAYTLAHWLPEIFPVVMYFAFGFPQALTSLQVLSYSFSWRFIISSFQILSIDLGSELPPAISLAYESSEKDIMKHAPRKRTSRLVGWSLVLYSYIIAGGIITIGCSLAYLSVYWYSCNFVKWQCNFCVLHRYHGISTGDLVFSSGGHHWQKGAKNFTSNGATFSERQQLQIKAEAGAAYHITLVMGQVRLLLFKLARNHSP